MDTFIICTQSGELVNFRYVKLLHVIFDSNSQSWVIEAIFIDGTTNILGTFLTEELATNVLDNLKENIIVRRTGYYQIIQDIIGNDNLEEPNNEEPNNEEE